ncbi:MAG: tetratricopeptide repeat protein [Fluviicola sp.]|nr:tetratricopeptide repeat protein [Fluviicola sp.]
MTDSVNAKKQLEIQRTQIKTVAQKQQYLMNKAWYFYYRNRFNEAENQLKGALKLKSNTNPKFQADHVKLQSLIAYKTNGFAESNRVIEEFLNQKPTISDVVRADLSLTLCENYLVLGEYEKAKHKAFVGYDILKKKKTPLRTKLKARIFSALYNTYYYQAKYDSALYYLYQAEPLLEDNTADKATFYDRIAIVYAVTKKHKNAIHYYKKSIAILEKTGSPILLSHSYYNIGESYKEVNLDVAVVYFEKALKTAESVNYDHIAGFSLQNLGDIYLSRKDYARAEELNEKAVVIFQRMNLDRGIVHTKLNLGKLFLATKQYDRSVEVLQEALVIALNGEDISDLRYTYEYLYKTYEGKGDYRSAYKYHKLFSKTQQKIMRLELQTNINKLNLTYKVKTKDAKNRLLKKQVDLKNKKITAEQITKWVVLCLLIVSVFAIVFLRRVLIQRAKLNELELSLTQSELRLLVSEKEQTLNYLEVLKQQLITKNALIGELNHLVLENEQNLISKEQLSSLTTNDQDWVQFLAKLQVLFPAFAESLKSKHPNLSNNEFRLAVLIKLNLSDKEISELLFIEISSVKKAKNRLKQKLQLDVSEKLDGYIGSL